jgi:hypothetical protein
MGRISLFLALLSALVFSSARVHAQVAQTVAAPSPPPAPPPAAWQPGSPPPPGYHVEDRPRTGLVIAGSVVAGIPYFFSVMTAMAARNDNATGWLFLPVVGPWMTMGQRNYGCNSVDNANQSTSQSLQCVGDIFVVMGLIADGVLQATGATLLLVGVAAGKPTLVRDDQSLHVTPMQVGTGYGAGLAGTF